MSPVASTAATQTLSAKFNGLSLSDTQFIHRNQHWQWKNVIFRMKTSSLGGVVISWIKICSERGGYGRQRTDGGRGEDKCRQSGPGGLGSLFSHDPTLFGPDGPIVQKAHIHPFFVLFSFVLRCLWPCLSYLFVNFIHY